MAENWIMQELNKVLGKFSKQRAGEEEEAAYVNVLKKLDDSSIEKYPRIEVHYKVYPSSFGITQITNGEKQNNGAVKEGVVPVISNTSKLSSLIDQLEYESKKTRVEKYQRIMKQSQVIGRMRREGREEEEIQNLLQIMPHEYDIHINLLKYNMKENGWPKELVIHVNNLVDADELDKHLIEFRDTAMDEILNMKIKESEKELSRFN